MTDDPFARIAALCDPPPGSASAERQASLDAVSFREPAVVWPHGFNMLPGAFCYAAGADEQQTILSAPFEILGLARDCASASWGLTLQFEDRDGIEKVITLRAADLAADGAAIRVQLASLGLEISGKKSARDRFIEGLIGVRTDARVRLIDKAGWSDDLGHFAMPERTFGTAETLVFEAQGQTRAAHFGERGTLGGWQHWVGDLIRGHDRLVFALACAFVGPLLHVLGAEPAIWHYRGKSSTGKSTALVVGASVWGPPALVSSWRGTANAFEVTAAIHSDLLLCLDEISVADARSVGDVVYGLANGIGKSRMASDGSLKNVRRWRTNVLSSGEIGLADKLSEDGRRHLAAGQSVRFIELGLDPSRELGIFDGSGTKEEAAAKASRIKAEAIECHGTAGPAFIERLVADVDSARREAKQFIEMFMTSSVPPGSDGQVTRVARKFAAVAAAGELAAKWCILPPAFAPLEISDAADRLFQVWLSERGGIGCSEDRQAILRLRTFLQTHSSARMPPLLSRGSRNEGDDQDVADRAADFAIKSSFRVQMLCGYQDTENFYLNDGGFKEALGGLDPASAADALFRQGYLLRAEGQRRKAYVTTPEGRQRLYRIKKSIMEFDDAI